MYSLALGKWRRNFFKFKSDFFYMSFMNNLHSKRCMVYFEDQWGIWEGQWNDQIYTLGRYSGRSIFQYRKVLENYT